MNDKRNVQVVPKIRRYTRFVPWLIVLFFGFQLANCSFIWPYKWRQKIIVTVDTPNGEKVGSAVSSVEAGTGFSAGAGGTTGSIHSHKGEASVVDLGNGKYLFVLIDYNSTQAAAFAFDFGFEYKGRRETLDEFGARMQRSTGQSAVLPAEKYPLMVTFDDVNDPKSVREVKPDDLASVFGAGYRLKGINVQITDEDVTVGAVEKILPTLSQIGKERCCLIPNSEWGSNKIQNQVSPSDFSTELYK
jgi:hypothetical protein